MLESSFVYVDSRPILGPVITESSKVLLKHYKEKAKEVEKRLSCKLENVTKGVCGTGSRYSSTNDSSPSETDEKTHLSSSHGDEISDTVIYKPTVTLAVDKCDHQLTNCCPLPDLNTTMVSQNTDTYSEANTASTDLNNYLYEPVEFHSTHSSEQNTLLASDITKSESSLINDEEPKLIRSSSFTLDGPSPLLIEYMKKYGLEQNIVGISSDEVKDCSYKEQNINEVNTSTPRISNDRSVLPSFEIEKLVEEVGNCKIGKQSDLDLKRHYIELVSSSTSDTNPQLSVCGLRKKYHKNFCKVSAAVKGYLTRRLLRTEKVQNIINTIKDTLLVSQQLVIEAKSNCCNYSDQDIELYSRIITQLDGAILQFHDIFFQCSIKERMGIISQDRLIQYERALKSPEKLIEAKKNQVMPKKSSNSMRNSLNKERKRGISVRRRVVGRLSSKSPYAQRVVMVPKTMSPKLNGRNSSLF